MKNYKSPEIKLSVFEDEQILASTQNKGDAPENELDNGGNIITLPNEDVFGK